MLYALTDKWYIHPYAENAPGRGYGIIDNNGVWKLNTVWRGFQSYKIAFFLVPKDSYVPVTVGQSIGGSIENSLLSKIKYKAYNIISAPDGI